MDFDPFKKKIKDLNVLSATEGNVLVAEPFMQDDYFKRSVVFICENNEEGTVGFILNEKLNINLKDVLEQLTAFDAPLYMGGPVEAQSLFFIHKCAELDDALPVSEGIYWSGDFEQLREFMLLGKVKENEIKFFLGYSGWDKQQLKDELENENWLIGKLESSIVFEHNAESLWRDSLKNMGKEQAIMANFPDNPSLN